MRADGLFRSLQASTWALAVARSFTLACWLVGLLARWLVGSLASELIDRRTSNSLTFQLVPERLQGFPDVPLTKATEVEISGRSGDVQKYTVPNFPWPADSSVGCYSGSTMIS